ncbi:acyl-CoA dehydrogenase [Nocardia mangyaensis]|uniref:Acyl-CoA dehydrogenase n=1 Tax=Nocardia mangyaensis TaxID=2213200 RepID=A0A1J0VQY9_9NOCA|nr:AMP-binding protein [Nocardia mangyaensis]APE34367.1 acyl-CoA dehydrogenase [Nocardia mangyaensis]
MIVEPFETGGIHRDEHGVAQYTDLPESLIAMLRSTVERWPAREAVVEVGGERLSFRQLWERATRVAGGLRDQGVRPGDRVACLLDAGTDWVVGFLGTMLAGAVTVPVNTRFAEPEIAYVLADSAATLTLPPGGVLPHGAPYVYDDAHLDDLAAIFYTSGTTGRPKGAMTTHRNLLATVENVRRLAGIAADEGAILRNLVSVPLFHVTACNSQLIPQLAIGGATIILPRFGIQEFLRSIVEERITSLTNTPAIYYLAFRQPNIGEFDLSGVDRVAYGGAPVAPALVHQIAAHFPNARLANGFGLTETSSISTYLPHEWALAHAESVGFAAPIVDLAIDAPDPVSGVGELLIRGANVVAGYWNNPEATAASFVDGWLRTGDLARLDDRGLLSIADRAKDMINRGGENVYCVEVENALAGAPGIGESAVVGVPDDMMGEKVGAVVVPLPGVEFDERAVLGHLRELLADFKVPQYFSVRTEPLPRNPGGKIVKSALRSAAFAPVARG